MTDDRYVEDKIFMRNFENIPTLSKEEQVELVLRIREGDKYAEQRFIESNMHLVIAIAQKYYFENSSLDLMDLVQEGSIGLIKAVRKYEPDKGEFCAYAATAIKREIRALSLQKQVSIPRKDMQDYYKKKKYIEVYMEEHGGEKPSDEELAKALNMSISRIQDLELIRNTKVESLHKTVGEDDKDEVLLMDFVAAPENHSEELWQEAMDQITKSVGETSNELMRKIMERYTFMKKDDEQAEKAGSKGCSEEQRMKELGLEFGVTAERARQIVKSYENYQNTIKNIQYVESYFSEDMASFVEEVRSKIKTAHTKEAYEQMNQWSDMDKSEVSKSWDDLFVCNDIFQLLEQIEKPKFGIFLRNYMQERFAELLTKEDILSVMCQEIRQNGYEVDKKFLVKILEADEVNLNDFWELALSLHMEYEDVEMFLKKVFQREGFNPFHPQELILQVAFQYIKGDKKEFVDEKNRVYKKMKAQKHLEIPSKFNTIIYKSQIQTYLDNMNSADEINQLLEHVKYLNEKYEYQRTADRLFLESVEELTKLTKKDVSEKIEPNLEKVEYAVGDVVVFYDCETELHIPKGQKFIAYDGKKELICETTEEVHKEISKEFQAEIKIASVVPAEGACANKTIFRVESPYIKGGTNKSAFKSADCVSGNITIICTERCTLPAGTIFVGNGIEYETVQEYELCPSVKIPVKSLYDIPKRFALTMENQEKCGKIYKIEHAKISKTVAGRSMESEKESRVSKALKGKLERYLYLGAGGNMVFGKNLDEVDPEGELREKLIAVMRETDFNFTNQKTKIQKKVPIQEAAVSREQLFTILMLRDMAREQFAPSDIKANHPRKRLAGRVQEMNKYLNDCGFYGVYPVNPYERLMLYISTFELEPLSVYRNIWGMIQDYQKEKQGE